MDLFSPKSDLLKPKGIILKLSPKKTVSFHRPMKPIFRKPFGEVGHQQDFDGIFKVSLRDCGIAELRKSEPRDSELRNCGIAGLWDCETVGLRDCGTAGL
jgi:hypothetical protein